jgi:hypothetical protein
VSSVPIGKQRSNENGTFVPATLIAQARSYKPSKMVHIRNGEEKKTVKKKKGGKT